MLFNIFGIKNNPLCNSFGASKDDASVCVSQGVEYLWGLFTI